jgi:hypothetical protein
MSAHLLSLLTEDIHSLLKSNRGEMKHFPLLMEDIHSLLNRCEMKHFSLLTEDIHSTEDILKPDNRGEMIYRQILLNTTDEAKRVEMANVECSC